MQEGNTVFYLKQLMHSDIGLRNRAILELGKLDDPHIFKILSAHFSDSHPIIRDSLHRIFAHNKTRQIAEIVADTLHSPQISVTSLAMEILRDLGTEAIFPLRRISKSENTTVRTIAARLLGDINDASASSILLEMMTDPVEAVRTAVYESLGKQHEIRALHLMLDIYTRAESQNPALLNAILRIVMHWEKMILSPDLLRGDSAVMLSFVNFIQDTGYDGGLNLLICWLQNPELGIEDEALKAIASILRHNKHVMLPATLFPIIAGVWEQYAGEIPVAAYLTCLSRMPYAGALEVLITEFITSPAKNEVEETVYEFVIRFHSLFLSRFLKLEKKTRLQILKFLLHRKAIIYDSQLIDYFSRLKDKEEKEAMLLLAALSEMPEAKKILLARLSDSGIDSLARTLANLRQFADENLWSVFKKYLVHGDKQIREAAIRGMVKYPAKSLSFLEQELVHFDPDRISILLHLVNYLPPEYAERFFSNWLAKPSNQKLKALREYYVRSGHLDHLLLVTRLLKQDPPAAQLFFSELAEAGLNITDFPDDNESQTKLSVEMEQRIFPLQESLLKTASGLNTGSMDWIINARRKIAETG